MRRLIAWYKNLKKWQKGGLIGCALGLLLACLVMLTVIILGLDSLWRCIMWEWITKLHAFPFVIFGLLMHFPAIMSYLAGSGAIVVCYGGFGAIVGRAQQVTNPRIRWLLTGLLALFLLFIYWFNFQVARFAENL